MCGITGYINGSGVLETDIQKMNDAIKHRGPDGTGIYLAPNHKAGLGNRRLSIIDLEGGRQPMSNEDDTLWITFNGEIYNFQEIKKNLKDRHHFKTKSDTEVILHLYEEKGTDCLQYLRGMFAFAIYDSGERKLFLARDHLGQKPLYYYHNADTFAFASEIKALLALKPELRELDLNALYEYFTIRIITPPRSMFARIRKLPPGHFLLFQNGTLKIERYWSLRFKHKLKDDFNSISEELDHQIASAVKYHLVSDVPVGAFLSGGLDSGLIVSMMSMFEKKSVKTFTGDVPYECYSELPYAKLVSNKHNTEHHELLVNPSLINTLPEIVWHMDEPSDLLSVCMYHLSGLARKKVKAVLGGDGGDELFGGYDRYYGNILVSYYALLPNFLRKHILENLINRVHEGFWYRSFSHKLKWMHQMSKCQGGRRYAKSLSYFHFSDEFKNEFYTDRFRKKVGMFDPEASLKYYFDSENASEAIDKMLFADSMVRMPDHPNMVLDRMTMAHGLEARSPFLDHKLAEFCAMIPPRHKVRGAKCRHIEIELAKKYLPSKSLIKQKQGFASAFIYLLADEFKHIYNVFLKKSSLVTNGFINQSAVKNLLEEHLNKKKDHGQRLWLLCNAEIWYRMFIENQSKFSIRELLKS